MSKSTISPFELLNPFSKKEELFDGEKVVQLLKDSREITIREAVRLMQQSKPKMVVENFATVVPTPAINFSNPSIDLGSAPVEPAVAPSQQLSDEEQKRANLLAAYAEIDGTAQHDTLSILGR